MKRFRILESVQLRSCVIREEDGQHCLYTQDGSKKLGCHPTRAEAEAQERAIQTAKHAAVAISEKDGRFCHVMPDGSERCHATREEATAHIAQVYKTARSFKAARESGLETKMYQGREHIVIPVVALVEGVIHASNAETPELVLADEFERNVQAWNGRPVMLDHPKIDDSQVSANDPRVLDAFQVGTVFDARVEDKKLKMNAYIDPVRLESRGEAGVKMLAALRAGDVIEVSVGTFVVAEHKKGKLGDRDYSYVWRDIASDHLAFLPLGLQGACSVEMGCGTRAAGDGERVVPVEGVKKPIQEDARAASCGCGGQGSHHASAEDRSMDKKARVAAVIASGKTCFKAADAAVLEQLSDEAIKELEAHVTKAAEQTKPETQAEFLARNPDIKAIVDAAQADATLTAEQRQEKFLKDNPVVGGIVRKYEAAQAARRAELVGKLKVAQKAYSETELQALSTEQLEKVALLSLKEKPSYEGQVPREASTVTEDDVIPAPPSLKEHFRNAKKAAN